MAVFPHPENPLDRAMWYVRHHRTHELVLDGLNPSELDLVHMAIRGSLHRARMRQFRAHAVGAAFTATFLLVGLALMMVGPAEVLGWSSQYSVWLHADDQVMLWGIMIVLLITGATGADYLLRRRLTIANTYSASVSELSQAITRVDAAMRTALATR